MATSAHDAAGVSRRETRLIVLCINGAAGEQRKPERQEKSFQQKNPIGGIIRQGEENQSLDFFRASVHGLVFLLRRPTIA